MVSFVDRFKNAWNVFRHDEAVGYKETYSYGTSFGGRPDRVLLNYSTERSIIGSIYTRLSIDTAAVDVRHVRLDDNGRYLSEIDSGFNRCLSIEANIDQAARHFRQNMAMTLMDKGVVAIVPVDTSLNPNETGSIDILTLRVGEIIDWAPGHVNVRLYDERYGVFKDIWLSKKIVAVIENPLYAVMNAPNSTLQRLIRKLNLLDAIDEQSGSGKLDLIIQLPYVVKSDARREQAEKRRKDIELQLKGSQYGIAYTDGTERITQLNRPAENNLLKQIEFLTNMLYSQLGLTQSVFDGTADEATMLNYYNRTIEPILAAIVEGMKRTFLTKTAMSQGQSVEYFRDPFKLVAVSQIAEIADKFTRNEILTSNEVRSIIGYKPSIDPKADELRNKNLAQAKTEETVVEENVTEKEGDRQNGT